MDLPHVGERILSLAQNIGMAKLEKKIAKTTLKEKPDMEMTNVGTSRTIQETISDEVKKAVTAALKQKGVSAPPSSESSTAHYSYSQVDPWKRKTKVQDPDGREGRVQEDSTQEILLGKNACRKAGKGREKEELPQRFQKAKALRNAWFSAIRK
jgi:hypothetical protein